MPYQIERFRLAARPARPPRPPRARRCGAGAGCRASSRGPRGVSCRVPRGRRPSRPTQARRRWARCTPTCARGARRSRIRGRSARARRRRWSARSSTSRGRAVASTSRRRASSSTASRAASSAGRGRGDTGAFVRSTIKALRLFGVVPERYFAHDTTNFDREPESFHYSFAQNFKALEYFRLDEDVEHLKSALGLGPAVRVRLHLLLEPQRRGRHANRRDQVPAAVRVGDRRARGAGGGAYTDSHLLFRNSWGTSWGEDGYGYLPWTYFDATRPLATDCWALVNAAWVPEDGADGDYGWQAPVRGVAAAARAPRGLAPVRRASRQPAPREVAEVPALVRVVRGIDPLGTLPVKVTARGVTAEAPDAPVSLVTTQKPVALYLKRLRLLDDFDFSLFGSATNELHVAAVSWDLSGNPPMVFPSSEVDGLKGVYSTRPGEQIDFVGDGLMLWPQRKVVGGLYVRLMILENDADVRAIGQRLSELRGVVAQHELATSLAALAAGPTGVMINAVVQGGGEPRRGDRGGDAAGTATIWSRCSTAPTAPSWSARAGATSTRRPVRRSTCRSRSGPDGAKLLERVHADRRPAPGLGRREALHQPAALQERPVERDLARVALRLAQEASVDRVADHQVVVAGLPGTARACRRRRGRSGSRRAARCRAGGRCRSRPRSSCRAPGWPRATAVRPAVCSAPPVRGRSGSRRGRAAPRRAASARPAAPSRRAGAGDTRRAAVRAIATSAAAVNSASIGTTWISQRCQCRLAVEIAIRKAAVASATSSAATLRRQAASPSPASARSSHGSGIELGSAVVKYQYRLPAKPRPSAPRCSSRISCDRFFHTLAKSIRKYGVVSAKPSPTQARPSRRRAEQLPPRRPGGRAAARRATGRRKPAPGTKVTRK